MEIEIFFLGVIIGMLVIIIIDGLENRKSKDNDCVRYFEESVSYEDKEETSFEVFQVLSDAALATEIFWERGKRRKYFGKSVLIRGKDFYDGQIINVRNPKRVGTYRYTDITDVEMTVPIIEGEME